MLPLSDGTAREKRVTSKPSLAGLSGKTRPSEDATRPSAIICNDCICGKAGGDTSILGFLRQLREITYALNQETFREFLNLDSFD